MMKLSDQTIWVVERWQEGQGWKVASLHDSQAGADRMVEMQPHQPYRARAWGLHTE